MISKAKSLLISIPLAAIYSCGAAPSKQAAPTADLTASAPAPAQDGAQGPAGPAGPAGPQGPQGPKGDQGSAGKAGAAGAAGEAGAEGAAGQDGAAGAKGARGPAGAVGLYAGATLIGYLQDLSAATMVTLDGTVAYVNLATGEPENGPAFLANGSNVGGVCTFASTDCSGQCLVQTATSNEASMIVKGTGFFDGHKLWRYQGDEAPVAATTHSFWASEVGCKLATFSWAHAWPMAHQDKLPAGAALPYGPLSAAPLQ